MSLRRSFILVFSALLTALAAFAAAFSYYSARNEAWSILDFQLQQIAHVVGDGAGLVPMGATTNDEVVAVRVTFAGGRPAVTNEPGVRFPERAGAGLSTFRTGDEEWRLYTAVQPQRTVMVAQRTAERDELAADAAWNSAWPFLLAIPLSWSAAYWLVGAIMERLQILATRVEARKVEDTAPFPVEDAPIEVRPLVAAINRAFDRVRETLAQQRAFLADAAHELRTPVTALGLQLGNVKEAPTDQARDKALADLEQGIRRAAQVSTQLLRLARSEADGPTEGPPAVADLTAAVQECLARFVAVADGRDIDLGLDGAESCNVRMDPAELAAVLDIIVDNALRYTPPGGRVDLAVRVSGIRAVVSVTDTGPGIPDHLRSRVFDRFFRVDPSATEGSGLGLAIARNLMGRNWGAIHLTDNPAGTGLRVLLEWPLA